MNIGHYRVGQKLGEGSLGAVFEGFDDNGTKRKVALKVLHPWLSRDPNLVTELRDLARSMSLLALPAVVRLMDAGRMPDDRVYLVSEFVPGESLTVRLKKHGRLEQPDALHVAQWLAATLSAAQDRGMLHLCLTPNTVMMVSDSKAKGGERLKLLDLGLSKLLQAQRLSGTPPRAPAYLAPEQRQGDAPITGQADVYALGVMLYEILAGKAPFGGDSHSSGGSAASGPGNSGSFRAPPTPLGQLVPSLPEGVVALVQAMMGRAADKRPAMKEVATRLAQLEEDLLIGQMVGSYRVVSKIAQGGMGTVFRAMNEQIGRPAAIKVMRQQFAHTAEVAKRFLNEARAVNFIRHPCLVEIFEFGQLQNGSPYIVMEFLEGESLEGRRRRMGGRYPETVATNLVHQMALAVAATHDKGIIHRDLKPDNVMIIPDPIAPAGERIKLLDFGIAKVTSAAQDPDSTLLNTYAGSLMGTPPYMAPEQFTGAGSVTDRTDVYALGVILYEMLAGKRPYDQVDPARMREPPPPPRAVAPDVSEQTAALITHMLSFNQGDRPSMNEVADRLRRPIPPPRPLEAKAEATMEVKHMKPDPGRAIDTDRPVRSSWRWAVLGAVVAGVPLLAYALWLPQQAPPPPAAIQRPGPPGPIEQPGSATGPGERASSHPMPQAPQTEVRKADPAALRGQALLVISQGLRDPDPALRLLALSALSRSKNTGPTMISSLSALVEPLLSDPDAMVQAQAAETLGQLGARSSAPKVSALLSRTADPNTFLMAAAALQKLADPLGQKRLREGMQARDPGVKLRAALILSERDRDARDFLWRYTRQKDVPQDLRTSALFSFARAGDVGAKNQLRNLLASGGTEQAKLPLAEQLGRLGDDKGRAFLQQVAAQPGPRQLLAARLLATMDDPRGRPLLRTTLADPAQPLTARLLAAEGLGACGQAEDMALLQPLLSPTTPPQLRQAAAGALLQLARG